MIGRADVFRLEYGPVVVVIDQPRLKETGVNCMVIGGDSKTYVKGGYDIYVFFTQLEKAERINF